MGLQDARWFEVRLDVCIPASAAAGPGGDLRGATVTGALPGGDVFPASSSRGGQPSFLGAQVRFNRGAILGHLRLEHCSDGLVQSVLGDLAYQVSYAGKHDHGQPRAKQNSLG